jgi:zinc transport system ATP-binding protein
MSSPTPAVEAKGLTVSLGGHHIIDSVSFSIPEGQTTAIIGPNGAGKSVLLRALLRLVPKEEGEVLLFGVPHERYQEVAHLISYIPQHFPIDPNFPLTVRDFFALKSSRRLGFTSTDEESMQTLLTLTGLEHKATVPLRTLSGGQLQRVLLAYSLMDKPKLLFLDEPSAGIDIQGQETIYALLKRIQQERGVTMVLVSHELEIVLNYSQQVLCLNKKLLCSGVPREVLSNEMLQEMYGTQLGYFSHKHT